MQSLIFIPSIKINYGNLDIKKTFNQYLKIIKDFGNFKFKFKVVILNIFGEMVDKNHIIAIIIKGNNWCRTSYINVD